MRKRVAVWALLFTVGGATSAFAHDLYLTQNNQRVCAGVGEHFPASMNAITPDRVGKFALVAPDGARTALKGQVAQATKQLCAPLPANGQQKVVEMTVPPRFIELKAEDFAEYTKGEGFKTVIAQREQSGKTAEPGRELYSRFSKLLLSGAGEQATKPVGHILEIVPEVDPATLTWSGGTAELPVRVFFQGKPLADVQVAAMNAGYKAKGHEFPVTTRTDENGRAVLKLTGPGLWYARLIHMTPAQGDPEFEWRSYFATVTFETGKKK